MANKYQGVYDTRWNQSFGTKDEDILALKTPRNQVQFFYYYYNSFIAEQLKQALGDCREKHLLELGCGRATSSIFQASTLGIRIYPSDYSFGALRIARRNIEKYELQAGLTQANLYCMPYKDESFDAIISLGTIEHIEEPEKAYREMYRLLKPEGVMISMNVPENPENIQRVAAPINRLFHKLEVAFSKSESKPWLDKKTQSKTDNVYRSEATAQDFAAVVRQTGFPSVEAVHANPFPTISPVSQRIDFLVTKLYHMILGGRKVWYNMTDPFISSERNARVHFIIAKKS